MTDIDRIKSAVDLAALVESRYPLNPGKEYRKAKGHDSLVVDTQRGMYYWNSKGESGDMIDWVGRHELGYNGTWNSAEPDLFKQAICWLAKYAGLPEPQFKREDTEARAARLTKERLMDLSADHYRAVMQRDTIQGWQYATERGFTPETITKALGYADGALHLALPEEDRPTAAELGLIYQNERGQWRDAIPAHHLVYIHYHRGRVEYFAGRAIAEKQHRNQRAPKKLFWADWAGYGKPVVIVEGQADSLSIAQLGGNGLALCGVNLSDFDPEWLKLYGPLYIWQDADQPGSEAARNWQKRLNDLAAALGPLVRIISPSGEIKDANEFLQSGATPDDLAALLKNAATWLDTEIERISPMQGADKYDALQPLFSHLAQLDIFQLNVYRSKVCKDLNISQSDFGRYLKAAKGTLTEDEEADFAKGGQYTTADGWTVLRTFTDDGRPKVAALASGSARIIEEISLDDGSNEPQLDFLIGGELCTGQPLPKVQVPAAEFAAMKWVSRWGSRFIVQAGRSTQDHLRAAIQHLSRDIHHRTIYTHTGWRKIAGQWRFLTACGALGSGDETIQVDLSMGRPDTNMTRYALVNPENVTAAMAASLNYWYVADPSITVPIWAAMFLAPLSPFLHPDFGLWLHGRTGTMKSSTVAAALAHFGRWQGKDGKAFLPSNFQSTANAILLNAFQAKDVPLVVDDFAPGATAKEMRDRDATASNLLRSIGNKAARGRMKDGRHFQADFPPRCFAIITAEDLPPTASIMARGIGVAVKGQPDLARLTKIQTEDSHLYPHAMAGFILWVQRHWEELEQQLPLMAGNYRDKLQQQASHARLPDAFGKLMAAIDTALFFGVDCGALSDSQAKERKAQAFKALGLMLSEHGEAVDSVDACRIFQDVLLDNLDARSWYLCKTDANDTNAPISYPVGSILVGYEDDNYMYLLAKTITEVMQYYQRLGTPFPVGKNTLYKRLAERGWLIPGEDKSSSTLYIPAINTAPRVLKFNKKLVLER